MGTWAVKNENGEEWEYNNREIKTFVKWKKQCCTIQARWAKSSSGATSTLKSLTSLLRGGEEEIIASNQPLDLTSSSLGIFFLVFIMNLPEGNDDASLGLLVGDSGSVSIVLQKPKIRDLLLKHLFLCFLSNCLVNEKTLLQCFLVTACWWTVVH